MIVGWAYFSELVSAHQRFKLRTFSNWANARIMLTLVCLFTGEWRLSSYVSAAISLVTFAIVWLVLPESHIWLKKMVASCSIRITISLGPIRRVRGEQEAPGPVGRDAL